MRHYLKLDLGGWSANAIEKIRNGNRVAIKHGDRTTPDYLTPSEFIVSDNKNYCIAEMYYGWLVPHFSMLNIGNRVEVKQVEALFPRIGDAVVANRWEEPTARTNWQNN